MALLMMLSVILLSMPITLLNTALYSQENISVPPMEQCLFPYTQTGSTDCGLYAITYAVDLAAGNNSSDIIYDHSAIRSHLSLCILENRISIFP